MVPAAVAGNFPGTVDFCFEKQYNKHALLYGLPYRNGYQIKED